MGHKIMGHAADNDNKSLKPHPDIHTDTDPKEPGNAAPHLSDEKKQREHGIEDNHHQKLELVIADGSPPKRFHLDDIVAVPCNEKLRSIRKGYN